MSEFNQDYTGHIYDYDQDNDGYYGDHRDYDEEQYIEKHCCKCKYCEAQDFRNCLDQWHCLDQNCWGCYRMGNYQYYQYYAHCDIDYEIESDKTWLCKGCYEYILFHQFGNLPSFKLIMKQQKYEQEQEEKKKEMENEVPEMSLYAYVYDTLYLHDLNILLCQEMDDLWNELREIAQERKNELDSNKPFYTLHYESRNDRMRNDSDTEEVYYHYDNWAPIPPSD